MFKFNNEFITDLKKFLYLVIVVSLAFTFILAIDIEPDPQLLTPWGKNLDTNDIWPEYPRPQMQRKTDWMNLNGYWNYAIADTVAGRPKEIEGEILVPFALESYLSGVERTLTGNDYLWYRKRFEVFERQENERVLLHFGAVDWETKVFVNEQEVGVHQGGFDSFYFDITDYLTEGLQELIVRVWDPSDKGTQPRGKQVQDPSGIWYTPVSGIWQTVWLEKVPSTYMTSVRITPDIDNEQIAIQGIVSGKNADRLSISILSGGKQISIDTVPAQSFLSEHVILEVNEPRLWYPKDPFLYDLKIKVLNADGQLIDSVESYFGMRKVSLEEDKNGHTRISLNNKPYFQFGLLDQGWWPDGLYTPPSEQAMLFDIEKTLDLGFNMIRKHVKVECQRYYYHCDKMGVLVWQDMPNGNYKNDLRIEAWETEDVTRPAESAKQFELELKEMIDEFYSFPSIIVWVPFNEGWGQYDTERITNWIIKYDSTRLVDSPSGWADRGVGHIVDAHIYPGPGMEPVEENRASVIGEFGGLGLPVEGHLWSDKENWGYLTFKDSSTLQVEFDKLIRGLQALTTKGLSAAIYTQTTDVEGEVNGLLTFDRKKVKVNTESTRALINTLYNFDYQVVDYVSSAETQPQSWNLCAQSEDNDHVQGCSGSNTIYTPISSFQNPFINASSSFDSNKLLISKKFMVDEVPERLYLSHFTLNTEATIFLNNKEVVKIVPRGGRVRHYTISDISSELSQVLTGENQITVQLKKLNDESSFDVGLFGNIKSQPNKIQETK